jgi:hypothetical protein
MKKGVAIVMGCFRAATENDVLALTTDCLARRVVTISQPSMAVEKIVDHFAQQEISSGSDGFPMHHYTTGRRGTCDGERFCPHL